VATLWYLSSLPRSGYFDNCIDFVALFMSNIELNCGFGMSGNSAMVMEAETVRMYSYAD